jgi:hypothetical protein
MLHTAIAYLRAVLRDEQPRVQARVLALFGTYEALDGHGRGVESVLRQYTDMTLYSTITLQL